VGCGFEIRVHGWAPERDGLFTCALLKRLALLWRSLPSDKMARFSLLLALVASASAYQGVAAPRLVSKMAASRVAPSPIAMSEPSEKATVIGAAAVGGIVGVYLFHELSTGVLFALTLAYAATTASSFGDAAKTAGSTASKAFDKAVELNEQYDVVPKAKSAVDTVVVATGNLNENQK